MKKNYINPIISIIDIETETLMVTSPGNIEMNKDHTNANIYGSDIKDQLGNGQEVDAGGYRNNLWGD
ncbi:MAG: hypothetical protein J6Y99_12770 [Bacteroidales bacterium]|nr:hypothetical protein [Bacteroidales bacterium]